MSVFLSLKNKRVVLLTIKIKTVRLGERIWRSPPKMLIVGIVSSRSDSRGFFVQDVFCYLGLCVSVSKFICSNYRLHLLSTVRPRITLTQCPHGLPSQEGTSQESFWVPTGGRQTAGSSLKTELLRTRLNFVSRANP